MRAEDKRECLTETLCMGYGAAMIIRRPLGHQIADQLRMDIIAGKLQTGDRLTQEAICARFETSRIPVRDAVQILSYEGLLRATPTGIHITAPSESDFEDMLRIEALLHSLATELAAERASDDNLRRLADLHSRTTELMGEGNKAAAFNANYEFHRTINRLANSTRLTAAIRANSVRAHWPLLPEGSDRMPEFVHDHPQLIDAMLARQPTTASALMFDHMTKLNRTMLDSRRLATARTANAVDSS